MYGSVHSWTFDSRGVPIQHTTEEKRRSPVEVGDEYPDRWDGVTGFDKWYWSGPQDKSSTWWRSWFPHKQDIKMLSAWSIGEIKCRPTGSVLGWLEGFGRSGQASSGTQPRTSNMGDFDDSRSYHLEIPQKHTEKKKLFPSAMVNRSRSALSKCLDVDKWQMIVRKSCVCVCVCAAGHVHRTLLLDLGLVNVTVGKTIL